MKMWRNCRFPGHFQETSSTVHDNKKKTKLISTSYSVTPPSVHHITSEEKNADPCTGASRRACWRNHPRRDTHQCQIPHPVKIPPQYLPWRHTLQLPYLSPPSALRYTFQTLGRPNRFLRRRNHRRLDLHVHIHGSNQ